MMEKDNMIFCILRFMSDRTFTLFERGPYGPFKGKHPLIIFRVFFGSNIGNDSSIGTNFYKLSGNFFNFVFDLKIR